MSSSDYERDAKLLAELSRNFHQFFYSDWHEGTLISEESLILRVLLNSDKQHDLHAALVFFSAKTAAPSKKPVYV